MAEYEIENTNFDEEKLDLIGNLITKVESILSPKPKSVWHLPGAEQRILSSMVQILNHGCKEDSEGKPRLWSFIFGLRVIRPDLWPNYELKYSGGNIPSEELVSLWLQISLHSHLLSNQLKALVDDRKRICTYFHMWALIRSEIYTDSLLIVLQALEHNSQDILARINPSLMVKFYSKRKKDQEKERSPFTSTENVIKENNVISGSDVTTVASLGHLPVSPAPDDTNVSDGHLSVWGEEHLAINSSKISPSFFQVDYSSSMFSDCEKSDINKHTTSVSPKRTSKESVISDAATKSCLNLLPQGKDEESNLGGLQGCTSQTPLGSILNNLYEVPSSLKEFVQNNDIVKPSPFLLQYLASKSKFSLTESWDFSKKSCKVNGKDPSKLHAKSLDIEDNLAHSSEFLCYESSENLSSKENCPPNTTSKPSTDSTGSSTVKPKRYKKVSANEKLNNCTAAMVQSNSSGVALKRSHVRSYSDGVKSIIPESSLSPVSISFSDKSRSSSQLSVKKRFMEDGGQSITPEADGFFPHPEPGQTLMDFLTSNQFSKASAQLDRENAHFSIAEAVLAALEQINYQSNGKEKSPLSPRQYESEDDNLNGKQLPFNRRKLRVRSSIPSFTKSSDDEPATTDHSIFDSPAPESTDVSDTESCSTLNEIQNKVEEELDNEISSAVDPSSAENVAIAILMHYNSKLLPKASELQWLVSEQEVPQKLLPLPDSVPISPDDAEGSKFHPLLRGTSDWAPPRPQLILTLHKNTKRKARLQIQNWRCAGCGLVVSEKLSSHFRLCNYLGRYFCTSCHTNKKAVIPAKVLHNWDFKKYSVCNFSSELLIRMSADPLFHLGTLNPRLYKQSRDLHQTHIYRLQLFHARIYVVTCNRATKERELLDNYPHHWSTEPHVYSLDDLLSVKKGQIINQIKHLTTTLLTHISKCQICLGQGFICEICREGSPIFPFQLDAVTQCTKCKECFHFLCFSPNRPCPRCQRRGKREDHNGASDR